MGLWFFGGTSPVLFVTDKLIRTDTTLDLSQKAEKVCRSLGHVERRVTSQVNCCGAGMAAASSGSTYLGVVRGWVGGAAWMGPGEQGSNGAGGRGGWRRSQGHIFISSGSPARMRGLPLQSLGSRAWGGVCSGLRVSCLCLWLRLSLRLWRWRWRGERARARVWCIGSS